ncbi:hypothetical protein L596_025920 [Steinernema carpocapsae]|uniref:5'-nucleotidase n=1 Tax=Steinernema carpocapsae TaxID=34508 RepID=A0A4U5M957_STECR|nr:hypothetical protein L596_025920 [Steinernema carpocapsae]
MESIFTNPGVRISDGLNVKDKLERLIADGKDNLVVISDFDYTMTKYKNPNGTHYGNTHLIFDHAFEKQDKEAYLEIEAFNKKYTSIEHSPYLTHEEKIPQMVTWFKKVHQNVIDQKLSRERVERIVMESTIKIRENVDTFLNLLDDSNIPLILFSAGNATVIEILFEKTLHEKSLKNAHIVSNRLSFNENGICDKFADPFIHCYSKNGFSLPPSDPYFHEYGTKQNVVVIGDSIGDLHMHEGLDRSGVLLKVGFYNNNLEDKKLFKKYLDGYDIVILGDGPFDACGNS